MKVLARGRFVDEEYGEWWSPYAYVDFTPECVEEAIFYHSQSVKEMATIRGFTFKSDAIFLLYLFADLADYVGFWPYYGGPGRTFKSQAYFRFMPNQDRVMIVQRCGLDI